MALGPRAPSRSAPTGRPWWRSRSSRGGRAPARCSRRERRPPRRLVPDPRLGALAWIGLVPLLVAARGLRPGAAFRIGWLGGFRLLPGHRLLGCLHDPNYTAVPFAVALGILALMASTLAWLHGCIRRRRALARGAELPVIWLAPLLWVALEWLRGGSSSLSVGRARLLAVPPPRPGADRGGDRRSTACRRSSCCSIW